MPSLILDTSQDQVFSFLENEKNVSRSVVNCLKEPVTGILSQRIMFLSKKKGKKSIREGFDKFKNPFMVFISLYARPC